MVNNRNPDLKLRENEAFREILLILDDLSPVSTFEWDYHMSFDGFDRFLKEQSIDDYSLIIDKEGRDQKTLKAALDILFIVGNQEDSEREPLLKPIMKNCRVIELQVYLDGITGLLESPRRMDSFLLSEVDA